MALPLYLAMTAAEISRANTLPKNVAYMACHFSPYGTGLSNFPKQLPKGSMVILNDRTPVQGHDPLLIAVQLRQMAEEWEPEAILLDFQRAENEETAAVVNAVLDTLPCPVGVSQQYAGGFDCPVFIEPPPLHCTLKDHIAPWHGREIWLEAALDAETVTVTKDGSCFAPLIPAEAVEPNHEEPRLHCRYNIQMSENQALFTLYRTPETLTFLLQEAEALGITRTVGLYQELGKAFAPNEDKF